MPGKGDRKLDCTGLTCPMPIIKMTRAVRKMKAGEVIEMTATDPGAEEDVNRWVDKTGHTLLKMIIDGGRLVFYVRKKKD